MTTPTAFAVSPSRLAGPEGLDLEIVAGTSAPHSIDGEEMLLASVLADDTPAAWALACNLGVKPATFFDTRHRALWEAVHELRRRGEPRVDLPVVAEHLVGAGTLEELGGYPMLTQITARLAYSKHTRFFAESLMLLWHRRHALAEAQRLREAALTTPTREEFAAAAARIGQKLIRLGRREQAQSLGEMYHDIEHEARARIEGRVDRSRWIYTGLEKFDTNCRPIGSMREDHYVLIVGGSGYGKSVVLRNIAAANLRLGRRILFYTRETSAAGLIEMLVATEQRINLNLLEELPRPDAARFYAECQRQQEQWADKLLFVVQHTAATPLNTVEDVCDHARAFVNLYGPPDAILVDYLQLFGSRNKIIGNSREAVVAHVSHEFQGLSRELDRPLIAAVQMNESGLKEMREIKRDENDRVIHRMPKPGDMRESQAPYHDADRVIFLYRPPVDCRGRDQTPAGVSTPEMWWYQEKRRRGCAGIYVRTWFEKRFTVFEPMGAAEQTEGERAEAGARKVPPGQRISKAQFMQGGAR
jgi:replicative DNA helicase